MMEDTFHEHLSDAPAPTRKSVSDFAQHCDVNADDVALDRDFGRSTLPAMNANGQYVMPPEHGAPPPAPIEEKKKAPAPAPPPAPPEPKAEPKFNRSAEMMADYSSTLPGLRSLVEKQVNELSRSITALTEFSDALPGTLDSMLLAFGSESGGGSVWRTSMLKKAQTDNSTPKTYYVQNPPPGIRPPPKAQGIPSGAQTPTEPGISREDPDERRDRLDDTVTSRSQAVEGRC